MHRLADPRRRMQAFRDLQESILQGEFHEAGLLRVICLPSRQSPCCLIR
jgi:hypothetical protein